MDQVEKYIMTRLYKSVFCPETTDDEKKDLATQNRIRCALWVMILPQKNSVKHYDNVWKICFSARTISLRKLP